MENKIHAAWTNLSKASTGAERGVTDGHDHADILAAKTTLIQGVGAGFKDVGKKYCCSRKSLLPIPAFSIQAPSPLPPLSWLSILQLMPDEPADNRRMQD